MLMPYGEETSRDNNLSLWPRAQFIIKQECSMLLWSLCGFVLLDTSSGFTSYLDVFSNTLYLNVDESIQ